MAAPRMAISHIQNTAPAPPTETAATTPAMLPMPTRVAVETMRVWKPEIAPFSLFWFFSTESLAISGSRRMDINLVRMAKNTAAGSKISTISERPSSPPPGRGTVTRSAQNILYMD